LGISLSLGKKYENCTSLSAKLIHSDGTDYGAIYTTGFVNLSNGYFLFTPTIPSSFRGAIEFYCGTEFLGLNAINPEEYENVDVKVSTRCATSGVGVPSLTNPIPINPEDPIELRLTDDYSVQESRSIDITSVNWPDLTGSTTEFMIDSRPTFIKPAQLLNGTSLRVELSNEELAQIGAGRWSYEFRCTLSNTHMITLSVGNIVIVPPFTD
jgi:hypothetical protein